MAILQSAVAHKVRSYRQTCQSAIARRARSYKSETRKT